MELFQYLDAENPEKEYENVREELIRILRLKGSQDPEAHVDEAFVRCLKNISVGKEIYVNVKTYVRSIALNVFYEQVARSKRELPVNFDEGDDGSEERALERSYYRNNRAPVEQFDPLINAENAEAEKKEDECRRSCLRKLEPDDLSFMVRYYEGETPARRREARRELAKEFSSEEAMRKKVHDIKKKLKRCVRICQKLGNSN